MMKKYLTEAEQKQLLGAAKACSSLLAQRDYWWMRLCIATGMRVNEMSLLQAHQARSALQSGWLVMLPCQRKGGKCGHEYVVTEVVQDCLQALLVFHGQMAPPEYSSDHSPLLWGRNGQRLSVRSYQARLQHWAQEAGLGLAVSPHWLRHTRGMNILRRSRAANPLSVVQQALGHVSISSTGVYTKMCREEYERDLRQIDGQRLTRAAARAQAHVKAHAQTLNHTTAGAAA